MKKTVLFLTFLIFSFNAPCLFSDVERSYGNDTLVDKDQDADDLLKYLKGTWSVKGSWQILEGEGKVKYSTRAILSGTETYSPILNGHFLEKKLKCYGLILL